jgi:alkylation response protein AidB-like acyl-CoA dehydrogenase
MNFDPSDEQRQLVDAFDALYAKWSTPLQVRAAEPIGFDRELWEQLFNIGALEMGVPEASGGSGATLLDLELVAEQHGRYLAPSPMLEAQVAVRLLARLEGDAAAELLASVLSGGHLVTLALHPIKDGRLTLVPGGAVADAVLALDSDGDRLVCFPLEGNRKVVPNLGSLPLGDVALPTETTVLGVGVAESYQVAIDEWMVLMGGALAGLAQRALEIGVAYVKEREAFGVAIGSFQAIAHRLADSATAVDGALLLARKAAWAADGQPGRRGELAAMSIAFAAETARDASYRSLHFHGGYGFMMEYDIQLFFRRAKAWPAILIEPGRAYALAAARRKG